MPEIDRTFDKKGMRVWVTGEMAIDEGKIVAKLELQEIDVDIDATGDFVKWVAKKCREFRITAKMRKALK